jgi:hypothetical protein
MAFGHLARPVAAVLLGTLFSVAGQAMDWKPDAVEAIAGPGKDGAGQVAAGLIWEWDTHRQRRALVTGQTELIASYWHANAVGGGSQGLWNVALVPVLRMELDRGRSPWVLELGIGVSWLSRQYKTPDKTFSSTWNFYDVIGAAYRFGREEEHEIGARFTHISNAGLKLPNPGEDFLLLRYSRKF